MKVLSLVLFILFISCAKQPEEAVLSAKREALSYLTEGNCDKALEALESVNPNSNDGVYVSLLASVYECRADYRELDTVLNNLDALDADQTNLFATMAAFESGQEETAPDSVKYLNIMKAIDTISRSSASPSTASRIELFGSFGGNDLNYQLLLLTTIGISKYLGAYGNVNTSGNKGAGAGTARCLAQYTYANITAGSGYLDQLTNGTCDSSTQSNSETSILSADGEYVRRLCEGVVLYNNFLDLLVNITLPSDTTELGNLVDVSSVLTLFKATAIAAFGVTGDAASITTYENIRTVDSCTSTANLNSTNKNHLEAYFSVFLEGNHN